MYTTPEHSHRIVRGKRPSRRATAEEATGVGETPDLELALEQQVARIRKLQRRLFAENRQSLLCIFQAMDAGGKDGTIRKVFGGVDPAGCSVHSFKAPSQEELDHDYLWRCVRRLPERGRIGVFNRSWYEEVLAVRVLPRLLEGQHLPERARGPQIWQERLESICDLERHLARNGTYILKFFLHISPEEQARRLMARLEDPDRAWKFARSDIEQRSHWSAFMQAYDEAMLATDAPHAPWYCIPADSKAQARVSVATQVSLALERMNPQAPPLDPALAADMAQLKRALRRGGPGGTGAVSDS